MAQPTILVATWSDGLFALTGEGRAQEIANQPVRGLAPDGRGSALAIVGGHALRRRAPGGAWSTLAASEFQLSCCMAAGNAIYAGTDDARLLRLRPGGGGLDPALDPVLDPIEGFDNVAGRDAWFAGSAIVDGRRVGPPLGIRSVAANADGSVLFANVHVGGIPRSTDGGRTWQPTIDIHSDVHEVRAHPADPDLVAAASGAGLGISRDAGATWTMEHGGLHGLHCTAVAFSGDDILVSAATDHFAARGKIYRRPIRSDGSPDRGITAVEGGLPAWINGIADTGCIAASGSTVVVVDRGGALYLSTEFGRVWSRIGGELPSPSAVLIC